MDLKSPSPPKAVPKSKIPVPSSLYVEAGRSNYLVDLSEQVYAEEKKELERTRREQRKLRRRKGKQRSGSGVFSDEEDTLVDLRDDDHFDYGPPGILHTIPKGKKRGKLRRRPSSEFGDSSIELLGPSASLETDESDGTRELLTESFEFDDDKERGGEGRDGSTTSFRRYSIKRGEKERRSEYKKSRKSRTVGGPEEVSGARGDRKEREGANSDTGGDRKEYARYEERYSASGERKRDGIRRGKREIGGVGGETDGQQRYTPGTTAEQRKSTSKSPGKDKWQREPGRPLSNTGLGSRKPSKSPSKSPAEGKEGERDERKTTKRSKERKRSRDEHEVERSPKRYPGKEPSSKEKVEKWKKDVDKRTGPEVERREGRRRTQQAVTEQKESATNQKNKERGGRDTSWSRFSPDRKLRKGDKLGVPGASSDEEGDRAKDKDATPKKVIAQRKDVVDRKKEGKAERSKRQVQKEGEDGKGDKKEGGVAWDPKEKYDPDDDWKKQLASKAPKAKVLMNTEGMDPSKLEERMKEDAVRDTAAGMRLMQLCQSGDWYGVDGHLRYFEKRIQAGVTMNTEPLKDLKDEVSGWTPLMYAIKDNRVTLADRMIELGCDVNSMGKDGFCAIHIAALHGRDDTIRFLIYKKADVKVVTEHKKQNLLHIAASRPAGSSASVLRTLISALPKEARLVKDAEGNIPLLIALKNGMKLACQELLSYEAETQLKMTSGELNDTPFHIAARKRDIEICRLFVDSGANIDAVNDLGQTALHIASELGDENMVKYLYLVKANPHLADKEDRTAIHIAAISGHTPLIDLLADKFKVSVFERTKDGSTLMHLASLHGHPETAMALFRKGVPLQMPNKVRVK